jgi:hypothetical protein
MDISSLLSSSMIHFMLIQSDSISLPKDSSSVDPDSLVCNSLCHWLRMMLKVGSIDIVNRVIL